LVERTVRTFRQRAITANRAEMARANADPRALWTGYDLIEQGMRAGLAMVTGACVEPRDEYQQQGYRRMQNLAPELGYERRPPAGLGQSFLHVHFERGTIRPDDE
jgi:hypothetical protein